MAKTKRILAFVSAVMILFTLSLGFAGCKDEDEGKVTFRIYLCDRDRASLSTVVDGEIRGVSLLCELKDGDYKEVTIPYVEENYIYVRYMMPDDEDTLFTCSGRRYYSVTYQNPDGQWVEKDSYGVISIAPQILRQGTFIYQCMDSTYDIPLENYYARHYFAQVTLIVE